MITRYIHCDVLVMVLEYLELLAAKHAAKNNLKTLIIDEKNDWWIYNLSKSENFKIDNKSSSDWLKMKSMN